MPPFFSLLSSPFDIESFVNSSAFFWPYDRREETNECRIYHFLLPALFPTDFYAFSNLDMDEKSLVQSDCLFFSLKIEKTFVRGKKKERESSSSKKKSVFDIAVIKRLSYVGRKKNRKVFSFFPNGDSIRKLGDVLFDQKKGAKYKQTHFSI